MLTRESFVAIAVGPRLVPAGHPDFPEASLRVLTLAELEPVSRLQGKEPPGSLRIAAILVAATLCNGDRETLFDVTKPEDIDTLCSLPFGLVSALSKQAAAVNGLGDDAVKDAEKN